MKAGRRTTLEAAIVALAFAAAFLPVSPKTVEYWFATGFYPAIQSTVTPLSNRLPFALFDVLSGVVLVMVVAALIHAVRLARRTRRAWPVLRIVGHLAAGAAFVYLAFLLVWGFNYRRVPMGERLVVEAGAPAPEAVVELGFKAASALNALYEGAHRVAWDQPPWEDARLREAFTEVQRALSDASLAEPGRLKRSVFGPYFRWTSVDGMINPFGLEVLVNPDLLPFERPFVAAHEWAHLAGYADESEASFVGWLTCLRANAPAQYSAWLSVYWQVNDEVNQSERVRLGEALAAGPRRDIEAIIARLQHGQWPWLRNAGWRVYDRYLKANRIEEGVRSYGAVVMLILRTRLDEGGMPVRRATPAGDRPRGS